MNNKGTAIITGGGSGIGRSVAIRLAEEGYHVGVIGRREKKLLQTKKLIKNAGFDCHVRRADVRQNAEIKKAMKRIVAATGPLTVVVACAGIGGSNVASSIDRWDNVIRTNLYGTYYTFNAAIELHALDNSWPLNLIAFASLLARIGVPKYTAYCASKAGVLGLVRSLAVEFAPKRIRVNAVCPGWVDTGMARKGIRRLALREHAEQSQAKSNALRNVPLNRMSDPQEVADLVAFIIGPGGVGFTGQAFDISNGSWMA